MEYKKVFENNRRWVADRKAVNSEFFTELAKGQSPEYLIIGCSDSRVPLENITGLGPGEAFIHRNIANLVSSEDQNTMSVIRYAVDHLKVKHIVVCGHSHCGGIYASLKPAKGDPLDPWLNSIRLVQEDNVRELDLIADDEKRYLRLIELNTLQQCRNISELDFVKSSIKKSSYPLIHAWIFDLGTGELSDLDFDKVV